MNQETVESRATKNRENAKKSTGPHNTGSTRFNATKHGLLANGITELDNPEEFGVMLSQLEQEHCPVGLLERELVAQIAIGIVRARRSRMLEAEQITAKLNPPQTKFIPGLAARSMADLESKIEVLDVGLPARLIPSEVETLTTTLLRYETANENKLYRCLNQLGHLQQLRRDKKTPMGPNTNPANPGKDDGLASFGNDTSDTQVPPLEHAGTP